MSRICTECVVYLYVFHIFKKFILHTLKHQGKSYPHPHPPISCLLPENSDQQITTVFFTYFLGVSSIVMYLLFFIFYCHALYQIRNFYSDILTNNHVFMYVCVVTIQSGNSPYRVTVYRFVSCYVIVNIAGLELACCDIIT
jgi:hypothetical protein